MERNEKGAFTWTHVRRLYRDWGAVMTFLKMLTLSMVMIFAFMTVLGGFKNGFSLKLLTSVGAVLGIVILGIWAVIVPSYYIWAWANGGVDEWEFEMDDHGIENRKVVRKAWRMKLLRGIARILLLLPSRGNQKTAMHDKKKVDVSFSSVNGVSCNEKSGLIFLYTGGDSKEIHVPREDYAEVLAFIEERLQRKKTKRKRTGGRKKAPAAESEEKEGAGKGKEANGT